ncbi:MAG: SP_1767 family glycosyltransferase [Candidatus Falkowbacteria bacterium]
MIPLPVRKNVGPYIGWLAHFYYFRILNNRHAPQVLTLDQTLDGIIENKLSVIRFGDGEMMLMENISLSFQESSHELAVRLTEILRADAVGLLICIPGIWGDLGIFTKRSYWYAIHHLFRHRHSWLTRLSKTQIYGDAHITRPYLGFKNKSKCKDFFFRLFTLWNNLDVVLIEGEKSRLGVGNDMFDNVKSLERIICPAENAYDLYDKIKEAAYNISKDKMVLISLGPTAKVLAYDLFLAGYRVLDIGHIDMEYEMFLRQETELVKVPYKYFNEIGERNPDECLDETYLNQITVRIK